MDSPLLPTFKRNPNVSSSPTGLMSNMSLEPMEDGDSFLFDDPPSHQQSSYASSSQSSGARQDFGSSARQSLWAEGEQGQEGQDDQGDRGDTPQPPRRAAPRFSLFAPSQSASNEDQDEQERDTVVQKGNKARETTVEDKARDDKLRESLYELRQVNEVFNGFLIALEAAKGHNEVTFSHFRPGFPERQPN